MHKKYILRAKARLFPFERVERDRVAVQCWPIKGSKAAVGKSVLGFYIRFLPAVKRRDACRAPQSAESCPRPQAQAYGGFCGLFERLTVGNGQALTPTDPRMRQALSPGTSGVEGRGLGRAQRRTGRRSIAGLCTSCSCERGRSQLRGGAASEQKSRRLFYILD